MVRKISVSISVLNLRTKRKCNSVIKWLWCVRACACVRACVCACVRACVRAYARTIVCMQACVCICVRMCDWECACECTEWNWMNSLLDVDTCD